MQTFLNNAPALTTFELAVVAFAALFLTLTPAVLALSDARRRRRALPSPLLTAEPGLLPGGTPLVEPPLESPGPGFSGAEETSWPIEAPVASPDMLRDWTDEAPPALSTPAVDAAAPVDAPAESTSAPAAAAILQSPTMPGAVATPPTSVPVVPEQTWVYRGPLNAGNPPGIQEAQVFQLLELRQARIANWPPESVRGDSAKRALWEEGERLAAQHDRQISSTSLSWRRPLHAVIYAGVATDGETHRLSFLLFEDMWPADAAQATSIAVFEISDRQGLQRSWVELR